MSKEYTLIGGNGTVVSPLEVTEDGDYVAGDSRAFNPVKVRTGGGGSSTLSGLTDVDISNPSDGQTLVYNATSGKWENGAGGGDIFETLGTISAATVTMTYDSEYGSWEGAIVTDIGEEANSAVRNFRVTLDGTDYAFAPFGVGARGGHVAVGEGAQLFVSILTDSNPVQIIIAYMNESLHEPTITNVSGEYYCASDELAVLLNGENPK